MPYHFDPVLYDFLNGNELTLWIIYAILREVLGENSPLTKLAARFGGIRTRGAKMP